MERLGIRLSPAASQAPPAAAPPPAGWRGRPSRPSGLPPPAEISTGDATDGEEPEGGTAAPHAARRAALILAPRHGRRRRAPGRRARPGCPAGA